MTEAPFTIKNGKRFPAEFGEWSGVAGVVERPGALLASFRWNKPLPPVRAGDRGTINLKPVEVVDAKLNPYAKWICDIVARPLAPIE